MADPSAPAPRVPDAFHAIRSELPNRVVIIATWEDERDDKLTIQDFVRDGRSFLPVFTGMDEFRAQSAGSGFEDKGVVIVADLLLSMLHGGETLVVNPGGPSPRTLVLPPL